MPTTPSWSRPEVTANASSNLAVATALYPILESIASHLKPEDLVPLAQTCQTIQGHMLVSAAAKANLLTKTLCPGRGHRIRQSVHHSCPLIGFKMLVGCGSEGYDVKSQRCDSCGVNTCDECRIHITYHVGFEDPGLDGRRWWAGYHLLATDPIALYPPAPADGNDKAWYLSPVLMKSLYDQGRAHAPFHVPAVADPEPLERILDVNIGRHNIHPGGRMDGLYQGEGLLFTYRQLSSLRTECVCVECFKTSPDSTSRSMCECSLRKRFIDRWLCIECYKREQLNDVALDDRVVPVENGSNIAYRMCRCQKTITTNDAYKKICNWCKGEILIEDEHSREKETSGSAQDNNSGHEDEEDANQWILLGFSSDGSVYGRTNADGAMAAMVNGVRVQGEQLNRALVERWECVKSGRHGEEGYNVCRIHEHNHDELAPEDDEIYD